MNIDIQPYIKNIDEKQEELFSLLHDNVSSIILPASSTSTIETEQPSANNSSKAPIVLGGVSIVGGLFLGDPLRWICVGAGLVSIVYGVSSSKKKIHNTHIVPVKQKEDIH